MGFGKHPHDNMEIITIMLEGDLQHRDSMGHTEVIGEGEIQVMSAGSGIYHSEANHRRDKTAKLLQIWVFPNKKNVEPRYDQFKMDKAAMHNCLQQIISPSPDDDGSWLHQDAWFVMGQLDAGFETTYQVHLPANGVYAYIIEGSATINGTTLNRRDAMGIWDTDSITIKSHTDTHLLLIEVPMVF
jgi:quercetin 2,3-dioxygenase